MKIYQLKITLKHIKPPIWRCVEVPADIGLKDLCDTLIDVMGWDGYHLMSLNIGGEEFFGDKESADEMGGRVMGKTKLNKLITAPKQKFLLEYDFGDGWEHDIVLEKILDPEPGASYPRCTAGKRACPPEDCGGPWGYEHLLAVLNNPKNPEHESMLEWVGGEFDVEGFSVEEVNGRLG
ncbi:MAG: plasmid pRiA4b ORF-3 family protein [Saprospiraceae bacterium]|nr:plasmid pRiA4b ORF-3 family protein [Saprospiraceae bacterium]